MALRKEGAGAILHGSESRFLLVAALLVEMTKFSVIADYVQRNQRTARTKEIPPHTNKTSRRPD